VFVIVAGIDLLFLAVVAYTPIKDFMYVHPWLLSALAAAPGLSIAFWNYFILEKRTSFAKRPISSGMKRTNKDGKLTSSGTRRTSNDGKPTSSGMRRTSNGGKLMSNENVQIKL
jgi:hypothetical protein